MNKIVLASLASAVVAVPMPSFAQYAAPTSLPPPPITLDPGSSASNAAPAAAAAPSAPAAPQVYVVGPDGKIQSAAGAPGAEPTNYFMGGDSVAPTEEPDVQTGGGVPPLHTVRRGDTLWDISHRYFNDPWQWPKVWSYNPQITNPHWIYPGDLVRLLPRGVFTQPTPGNDGAASGTTDVVPAPQRNIEATIRQTAFVEKAKLDSAITIDGAVDEKVLLGTGDAVYLKYPNGKVPKVGEQYSMYLPGKTVKANGKDVGAYVRVVGTVEVTGVTQDKRTRGMIVESNQEIERGTKVGPLLKTFKTVPPVAAKVDAQGSVVAMLSYDQLIGDGEVVFVDLGKSSKIEIGNTMYVVRRGDGMPEQMSDQAGQDDRQFPARRLGRIVIVDVGERISVGLVTLSVQEMSIGDLVIMQASR